MTTLITAAPQGRSRRLPTVLSRGSVLARALQTRAGRGRPSVSCRSTMRW